MQTTIPSKETSVKKTFESTGLISIEIGDKVIEKDTKRIGVVKSIKLVPNGRDDRSLVALIKIRLENSFVTATSDRFEPVPNELYEECYPSLI